MLRTPLVRFRTFSWRPRWIRIPHSCTPLLRISVRPACDRPRNSNRDRVAHRNGQFSRDPPWNYRQELVTGGSFDLTTIVPIGHPRRIGLFAKFDLPKYLRE